MNNTSEKPTILIVDDAPSNIQVLIAILARDYAITAAINGEEALRATTASKPDLILLDVKMPGMNGFEICKKLKEDPTTRDTPIIFVTAAEETGNEATGLELGAEDYITKPFSPPVLKVRIRNTLERIKLKNYLEGLVEGLDIEQIIGDETTEPR